MHVDPSLMMYSMQFLLPIYCQPRDDRFLFLAVTMVGVLEVFLSQPLVRNQEPTNSLDAFDCVSVGRRKEGLPKGVLRNAYLQNRGRLERFG